MQILRQVVLDVRLEIENHKDFVQEPDEAISPLDMYKLNEKCVRL